MRKIQLFIATSLDGYIARPDGGIDWLFHDGDYGYRKFYAGIDTVVMGRKSWELARTLEQTPFAGKRIIVFSRKLKSSPDAEIARGNVRAFVRKLRQTKGRNIWLLGGAKLVRDFVAADLIDDYIISVHPILIGSGIPLFLKNGRDTKLKLRSAKAFKSGLVQLTYTRS
jgi:dihydrofolate reductase